MIVEQVDVVFADVAQPDQSRIIAMNCHYFLKKGGHFLISIKANCIDSTKKPRDVFDGEIKKLQDEGLRPREETELDPYEKNHIFIIGDYRPSKKKTTDLI
eukprot:Anaeramoba_flamelloidesc42269_g1_i3.p1 GENE.c42269_g1_i3~~c42269_g1_i3.p1  ORF type:complete len:101 (-),score=26.18 c42269_g1_i3:150-452(-)